MDDWMINNREAMFVLIHKNRVRRGRLFIGEHGFRVRGEQKIDWDLGSSFVLFGFCFVFKGKDSSRLMGQLDQSAYT